MGNDNGKLFTVEENDTFIFQVDSDWKKASLKSGVCLAKTFTKKDLFGVKNLSASFMARADLMRQKFDAMGIVKYTIKLKHGSTIEIGVRCSAKGEIVIPISMQDKNGNMVGIEVKATLDPIELGENGVNLVVGIPLCGGQLVIKWNPVTQMFTIQFRRSLPKKDKPEDADEDNCVNYVLELNPLEGFELDIEHSSHKRRVENEVVQIHHHRAAISQILSLTVFDWRKYLNNFFDYVGDRFTSNYGSNNRNNNYAYN